MMRDAFCNRFENCSQRPRRYGFTLVELLVVIAIIGILIALLMPAIQSARESGRQASCKDKIKNIGQAVLDFTGATTHFPVSHSYDMPVDKPDPPATELTGKGWIIDILPQLEQSKLQSVFVNPVQPGPMGNSAGILHATSREAMKVQLPILMCPSDASSSYFMTNQHQLQGIPVASTNYKGVIGDTRMGGASSIHQGSPDCHRLRFCPGLFWRYTYLAKMLKEFLVKL